MTVLLAIAGLAGAYACGAIPTGLWAGRLKGVDVRSRGSGNVGATNVARTAGKWLGILVLIVDVAKGWFPLAVLFPKTAAGLSVPAAVWFSAAFGLAAVAGHIWNPFLKFNGGKGVAASLGVLIALDPRVAGGAMAVWGIGLAVTRIVSVSSILAAFSAPFWMALLGLPTPWVLTGTGIGIAIISRHRSNILRLLHGEEPRIGKSGGRGMAFFGKRG
ncbi:MAG: acyl-phosphate glycerol 3-phosphate acyltransferase [Candidatus Omnitrophica bacterium CG11_big_fil_rev_8_21_14_0_20_64_10]|nr:MAG: acyl-phosphate glycerol 3-phosphate acyltransferase [Candidatus Omnitrophica bacterium CG11_big_fil_rev_8_21_14_0_20_64_10]